MKVGGGCESIELFRGQIPLEGATLSSLCAEKADKKCQSVKNFYEGKAENRDLFAKLFFKNLRQSS